MLKSINMSSSHDEKTKRVPLKLGEFLEKKSNKRMGKVKRTKSTDGDMEKDRINKIESRNNVRRTKSMEHDGFGPSAAQPDRRRRGLMRVQSLRIKRRNPKVTDSGIEQNSTSSSRTIDTEISEESNILSQNGPNQSALPVTMSSQKTNMRNTENVVLHKGTNRRNLLQRTLSEESIMKGDRLSDASGNFLRMGRKRNVDPKGVKRDEDPQQILNRRALLTRATSMDSVMKMDQSGHGQWNIIPKSKVRKFGGIWYDWKC